jgi:itaconate CoA-transferase
MNACAAIVEALYVRERTGKGRAISTSLFDGLAEGMPVPLIHREYTGVEPKHIALNHATIASCGPRSNWPATAKTSAAGANRGRSGFFFE